MRSFLIRVVSIVGAVVALVTTFKMARKQLEIERAIPKVTPTPDQLSTPHPIQL